LAYTEAVVKAQALKCPPLFTKDQVATVDEKMIVRIGPLDGGPNQMLIPEPLNPKLTARCFDVDGQGNLLQNPNPAVPQVGGNIPLR
jgi:hypothetical protein